MKIYLTRHGQTHWNKIEKLQGWKDSELTEKGIESARKLGEEVKNIDFDIAFTSDLGRTVKTAEIVLEGRDVEILPLKELRELSLGKWEGELFHDLKNSEEDKGLEIYFNKPHLHKMEGTEDFYDLMERIDRFFQEYIFGENYENVLIVTHGVTVIAILNYIESISVENFWREKLVEGCEISLIDYSNGNFTIEKKASPFKGLTY